MSERLVRERTRDRIPQRALRAALPAPRVIVDDTAIQHRPIGLQRDSEDAQPELFDRRINCVGRERVAVAVETGARHALAQFVVAHQRR